MELFVARRDASNGTIESLWRIDFSKLEKLEKLCVFHLARDEMVLDANVLVAC